MLNVKELKELIDVPYEIKSYSKNQIIYNEDDLVLNIGIVYSGEIRIETSTIDGFNFEIQILREGAIFGDALVYEESPLVPGNISSITDSKVIFIERNNFKKLLKDNHVFLENYLEYNAKRNIKQQFKIKLLGQPSIKEKILFYLKEEMKKQKSNKIKLNMNKENLSSFLGLNRPSLSRELMRMKKDGIIDYDKYSITYLQ